MTNGRQPGTDNKLPSGRKCSTRNDTMATYAEMMAQARQLHLSGDTEGARRLIARAQAGGVTGCDPRQAPGGTDPQALARGAGDPEAIRHALDDARRAGDTQKVQRLERQAQLAAGDVSAADRLAQKALEARSAPGHTPEQQLAIQAAQARRANGGMAGTVKPYGEDLLSPQGMPSMDGQAPADLDDLIRRIDTMSPQGTSEIDVARARAFARQRQLRAQMAQGDQQGQMLDALLEAAGGSVPKPTGEIPADMFFNPVTNQYTSREMLRNNVQPSQARAAIGGGMQGVGFQMGDEVIGGLGYLEGGPDMANFRREEARATLEADAEAFPKTALGSEIGGAVATGLATAPLAAAGTLPRVMARGAALGATEGGLHGFGRGEGGAGSRLETARTDAAVGAAIGGLAPPLLSAGRAVLRGTVTNPAGGMIDGVINRPNQTRANRALMTAVQRSGLTPEQLTEEVTRAAREWQPQFTLADAMGNPGQRMLSGIARQPGDARKEIADYLNTRQAGQGRRMAGFLDEGLNAPVNAGQTANQVTARLTGARDTAADAAYDAARQGAGPVDVRGALDVIDARIGGMQGSGVAGDGIDGRLARYRSRLAADTSSLPDGTNSVELSDFNRILGVKQDLGDDIQAATRAGRGNEARELGKLQDALDAALEAASDGYRAANDGFRTASRTIDAVEEGRAMRRPSTRMGDNLQRYGAMTPEQQAAARAGYAGKILGDIENAAPNVDKSRALMDDGTVGELGAMARDPDLLQRQIGRESIMFDTRNHALGGSRTTDNGMDVEEMRGFDMGLLGSLLTGRWIAAAQQAGQKASNAATGQNEATRELIARALLSRDPQAALAPALRQAMIASGRQRGVEAGVRSGGIRIGR